MMKRIYWWFRERTLGYRLHQTYMYPPSTSTCTCRDCRHTKSVPYFGPDRY